MNEVKLQLPKKEKIKGLYLFCNSHKKLYKDDSKVKCKCNNLVYKSKVSIPGQSKKCRTRAFLARSFEEAVAIHLDFKKELEGNSYQKVKIVDDSKKTPILLIDCMDEYEKYLNDIGVEYIDIKNRDPKGIKDNLRYLHYLLCSMKENDVDPEILQFTDINKKIISFASKYGLETREFGNRTFNNYRDALIAFANYIIKTYKLSCGNIFHEMPEMDVEPDERSVTKKEFMKLLEIVAPENGWNIYKSGKRKNLYKPWLWQAFVMGLYTGGRREEVVKLKWNGIKLNEDGEMICVEVDHFKMNRINSKKRSNRKKKFLIDAEFSAFLMELGYEEYKNTDRYILAPESAMSRKTMMAFITDAFSHYFKQLNSFEGMKNFKHLRKTFITAEYIKHGDKTHERTGHSNMQTLFKHYIIKNVVMEAKREEINKGGGFFGSI